MKLGILGGTFDPPHNGHLQIAAAAQAALELEQIVFMPARQPPHKLDDAVSPLETRVALLELALLERPAFVISLLEAHRQGPSYTVDTLRALRAELGGDAEIFFIMGEDSLQDFSTWHQPEEIVKLCKLAVLQRPGYDVNLDELERTVRGVKKNTVMIRAPEVDISSREIRERVARGQAIREFVPPLVADYIESHHLYSEKNNPHADVGNQSPVSTL
jgi:nicotinate-nucleotide adenylyltransferase